MAKGNALCSAYGAFELKATYQRNLLMGTLLTAGLVMAAMLGAYIYWAMTDVQAVSKHITRIKTISDIGTPPTVAKKPPRIDIARPKIAAPKTGILTPVADDEAPNTDAAIPTQEEIRDIINQRDVIPDDLLNPPEIKIDIPEDEYMPEPNDFVPIETPAEMMFEAVLEYPRLARQAGLEAVVWVKVLVDKSGDVKKAMIFKSSGSKAGFDEAAIASALKCKFKPAVQNGRPVAVWVAFTIEFSLTESPR